MSNRKWWELKALHMLKLSQVQAGRCTAWHRICMLNSHPLLSAVLADSEQKEEAKQNEGEVILKSLGFQIL